MSFWSKIVNTVRPARLDDEIAAEIEDHIARRTASLESEGLSRAEARWRASRAFGNAASIREQGRDIRAWTFAGSVARDVRHALRGMRRSPAFAITAVVTLALTTAAVTALYSVVDAAMLSPLPVSRADRLFTVAAIEPQGGVGPSAERTTFSVPVYRDFRAALGDVASLSFFSRPSRVEIQATSNPSAPIELAVNQFIFENAFDVLRVPAAAGTTAIARANAAAAILSWDFWQRHFAGSPTIVGRMIRIDGRAVEVIGVAARGFFGIEPGTFVDVWRPVAAFDPGALTNRSFHWGSLVGRMGDTATVESLGVRLQAAYAQDLIEREAADSHIDRSAASLIVRPAVTGISDRRLGLTRPLYVLLAIALLTTLIASVNVGSLLVARAASRVVEMAVRASLGASRLRLLQQFAIEHMVLAFAGGAAGWIVAAFAAPQIGALLSEGREPMRFAIAMNARVLIFFCAVLSIVSGLFLGALPACYALSNRQMARLRIGSSGGARIGFGRALIAAQVAIAFCLVATGLAFTFSIKSLFAIDAGFDARGMTVLSIGADRSLPLSTVEQFQRRIAAQPEVENAAVAWWGVFGGNRRMERVIVPGSKPLEREEIFYRVSPNYLATLGTPLLDGRDFTFADTDSSAPVPTIVNRTFARRYFGTNAVVGRMFQRTDGTHHQIVGVSADSYYDDLRRGPDAIAYFPMKSPRWFTLYVRSGAGTGRIAEIARREVASLGSGAHVIQAATLDDLMSASLQRERLLAAAGGVFAAIGLLIGTVGIFGFLTFTVSSQSRELGIRAALGAAPRRLTRLVLASLLWPVTAGLILGLAGAICAIRLAGSLLFGVGPLDPVVLIGTTAIFIGSAATAALLPVRKAAAVDPASVFRT